MMRSSTLSPKARAIAILSRREYSRAELQKKLIPYYPDLSSEDLSALLDDLEKNGFLSNQRFVESFVRQKSLRQGTAKILHALKDHQIDSETLLETKQHLIDTEFERAYHVWKKKFSSAPISPADKAKQIRFLASRGFSQSVIYKLFRHSDSEDYN